MLFQLSRTSYLFLPIFLCFFCFSRPVISQNTDNQAVFDLHQELKRNVTYGLSYLENTQRKQTIPGRSYRGEWPTVMGLQRGFFLLGGRNKWVYDSNCFSVASIHNSLAQIYLAFPEYKNIKPMLNLSYQKVLDYQNGEHFNFWNLLPPNKELKKGDVIGSQPLVRRPTNYKLTSKYINKAANVVEDADDTGLAYAGLAWRKKIQKRDEVYDSLIFEIDDVSHIFDRYRDLDRNNRHWYNYLNKNDHETGAYLTWLGDEYQFKHWNIVKVLGHNATFFMPFSECYPHAYVPYIPYGSNDLDGVVNANILSTLSLHGELDALGVDSAISYLNRKGTRKKYDRVGIYYPNRYHFPFAVSEAYANGVDRLEPSCASMTEYLLETQHEDGSWTSRKRVNKRDQLQSTAYALNALINFGDFEERKTQKTIEKALKYILSQSITDTNGIHWVGGVFFSGGTVVRNTLFWKSDAYTTAIILKAFSTYIHYIESKYYILAPKKF